MKKLFSLVLCGILAFSLLPLTSCKKDDTLVLNVYNWEDYIACEDYDMVAEFEKWYPTTHNGKTVKVNYSTFGTNENMYNELKLTQKKDGTYRLFNCREWWGKNMKDPLMQSAISVLSAYKAIQRLKEKDKETR